MGSFYENMIVWRADVAIVLQALGSIDALAAVAGTEAVVVFYDDGLGSQANGIAQTLSDGLDCRVSRCQVHDDDILFCQVWANGALSAAYAVPDPAEYFGIGEEPAGTTQPTDTTSDLDALVVALAPPDQDQARQVLTNDYVFAVDRHADLLAALGLPTFPAGWGRSYLLTYGAGYDGPQLRSNAEST